MKIKELLSDDTKWTKYCEARWADGTPCHHLDVNAAQWCLMGAIGKCYGQENLPRIRAIIVQEIKWGLPAWNDDETRKFEDVKTLVEKLDI